MPYNLLLFMCLDYKIDLKHCITLRPYFFLNILQGFIILKCSIVSIFVEYKKFNVENHDEYFVHHVFM